MGLTQGYAVVHFCRFGQFHVFTASQYEKRAKHLGYLCRKPMRLAADGTGTGL